MGTLYNPPFTVEDAIARGHDVFEVIFTNWGVSPNNPPTVLADFANLQYPPPGQPGLPSSLAGIAIGPKSTVDRAWVTFNLGKRADVSQPVDAYNLIRMLSVESPLLFTQASNPNLRNNPLDPDDPVKTLTQKGALYVYPFVDRPNLPLPGGSAVQVIQPGLSRTPRNDSTVLPEQYRDANGVLRDFKNALVPLPFGSVFLAPTLHLVCYLKNPYHHPAPRRAPLQYRGKRQILPNNLDPTPTEQRLISIPTYGRRKISIALYTGTPPPLAPDNAGIGNASLRIGGIFSMGQLEGIQEVTLGLRTGIPAGTPILFEVCSPGVDYLNLYAAVPVQNLTTCEVNYVVTAHD